MRWSTTLARSPSSTAVAPRRDAPCPPAAAATAAAPPTGGPPEEGDAWVGRAAPAEGGAAPGKAPWWGLAWLPGAAAWLVAWPVAWPAAWASEASEAEELWRERTTSSA